jgi:hypothetical protein
MLGPHFERNLIMQLNIRRLRPVLAGFACAAFGIQAGAAPVSATGGWVANFSPAMADARQGSTTVFQFEGSYRMQLSSKQESFFLLTCVGMETATKRSASETQTKGSGRCELKDKHGDKLFAGMDTAFDGFTLTFDGGTGKWASATGKLVSKETFTLESEQQLKGYSNMHGELRTGNKAP